MTLTDTLCASIDNKQETGIGIIQKFTGNDVTA